MKQTSKSLVFFGSGPVAASSLQHLAANFAIEAVITKPVPAHHRGSFPVIDMAEKLQLPLHFTTDKSSLNELLQTKNFSSPVGVVVDYGIIISPGVIDSFPLGIINSHFSLLPQWRGADPITFAILSGQKITGVSLMKIVPALDEGMLLSQQEISVHPSDTTPSLTDRLVKLSNTMLSRDLPEYIDGQLSLTHQSAEGTSYSRKITKQDGTLDTSKPTEVLERQVRAFAGWPKSRVNVFGHTIIVVSSLVATNPDSSKLIIKCANKTYLEITKLTAPNGKSMSGEAFLHGYAPAG